MTIELNDVLLRGEEHTLSILAREGRLTCITGGTATRRTRWLHAIMGFEPPVTGYVSVDGEPLTGGCVGLLRRNMAFVPASLETIGQVVRYEPPLATDVLKLRANRNIKADADAIEEECSRTGATGQKALLLAVAALMGKDVLVVDSPEAASASYLKTMAVKRQCTVIVASDDDTIGSLADSVADISSSKIED